MNDAQEAIRKDVLRRIADVLEDYGAEAKAAGQSHPTKTMIRCALSAAFDEGFVAGREAGCGEKPARDETTTEVSR